VTRESREFKEKTTLLEEDLRITNKQLERATVQIQRLERDLDEVRVYKHLTNK
jgi:5-bromo-4-chloroindolyl phosphate hydrolysis protein